MNTTNLGASTPLPKVGSPFVFMEPTFCFAAFGPPLMSNVEGHHEKPVMPYDAAKVEEAVLALLGVFEFENGRAWKRFDFDVMDALHQKGYITDPKGRHESVHLTEQGMELAKRFAGEHFGF